jgi:hypothetical protein
VDLLNPVERACRVRQFADPIVERALALADPRKLNRSVAKPRFTNVW